MASACGGRQTSLGLCREARHHAGRRDEMLTPVDYFRHRPTSHRFLPQTVDLLLFMKLFDPSKRFWYGAGRLRSWHANCFQPYRHWVHGAIADPKPKSADEGNRNARRITLGDTLHAPQAHPQENAMTYGHAV